MNDSFIKKIKKNIYGKPQTIKAIFPAGLSEVAYQEVKFILENLWFPQKFSSECTLLNKEIRIQSIHMFAITELLMRSQCLTDIRLVLFEGKAFGKSEFLKKCLAIDWNFFISKTMSIKLKINSIASKAFHETGLKEILSEVLKDYAGEIVSGEDTNETTYVFADFYKNRLTISISLAGSPLYKRGYRGTLSASAPLREDAASCCLKKALQFANQFSPEVMVIPFSGTGTFAFEYLQMHHHFSPVLFGREYALQKMPLFRQESFNYLLKKAHEYVKNRDSLEIICIDRSVQTNAALLNNLENVRQFFSDELSIKNICNDFFTMDVANLISANQHVFMPLNPPYGVRLGKNINSVVLYKNIAKKINEIVKIIKSGKGSVLGFVLCPSEESWLAISKNLLCSFVETYHFTQGGMDIRVCQFFEDCNRSY